MTARHASDIEADVRALARRIADAGSDQRARVYSLTWWSDKLLDWAMDHADFKTQLFRFIDVFPSCTDDADVLRHLEEYFEGIDLPTALDLGLGAADKVPFGGKVTASVTRRNIERMARQFIAGETPHQAMPQLRTLWRSGEACTVDLLGEKTVTDDEADRYETRVHELMDALGAETATWAEDPHLERDHLGTVPRVNVSVKPTALAPLYAPTTRDQGLAQAEERMSRIVDHARELDGVVYLDMEHYDVKDMTLDLARRIGATYPDAHLGVVVQAYLKDSPDDLREIIGWADRRSTPLSVRLVKGAYWDYETVVARAHGWPVPVFERKDHTDANYERCVDTLLDAAATVRPAFGSHNLRTIAYAMTAARARGAHETSMEIQLLYGMAEPVHAALRRLGMRVRAYAPIGEMVPGMAYLVRRLLENTANESFLRSRFVEGTELDELLDPPDVSDLPVMADRPPVQSTDAAAPTPFDNEPDAEFRRGPDRARLAAAVARCRGAKARRAPVVIGGKPVKTSGELVSVNPADPASVVCRAGRAGPAEADRAIEVASAGWGAWKRVAARERAATLFHAAATMRERREELAALIVIEAGKPWPQADAEVCETIDFCEYYGREAIRLDAGALALDKPGETNAYRYHPRGVVTVIAPWNFPLAIPCGMVSAALVTGNAVLFKPAEQTPGIAWELVRILHASGVPGDVLAFLPGVGEEVGAHCVDHPDVSMIAFTGSKPVGLDIVRRAAVTSPDQRHVKRVVAEMGGKNAIVVDSDADLDVAVPAIVDSAFGYAGQKCSAASRVIGVGPVFDALVQRLAGATRLVPVGPPERDGTVVGPLIDEAALDKVRSYQRLGAEEGEIVLQREAPSPGFFAGPTVMVTDRPDGRVATEEVFGPLVTCMRADDIEGAVALANATPYALTAGLFSRSPSHIGFAASAIRAGNLYINRGITGALVGRQAFGGYGLSGVGSKAGGPDYLLQFCEPHVVTENTIRQGFAPLDD